MPQRRKLRSVAEAREALEAVERAGVHRVAWAHANQVDARSLNAWRLILGRTARAWLRLVELVAHPDAPPAVSSGCAVRYGDLRVEIEATFDDEALVLKQAQPLAISR